MLKCMKCPYHLGIIKCPVSPCPVCKASGRKINPFSQVKKAVKTEDKNEQCNVSKK